MLIYCLISIALNKQTLMVGQGCCVNLQYTSFGRNTPVDIHKKELYIIAHLPSMKASPNLSKSSQQLTCASKRSKGRHSEHCLSYHTNYPHFKCH